MAGGIPLTIRLLIEDQAKGCSPMANAAVYAWHCDREGRYSLYSPGATGELVYTFTRPGTVLIGCHEPGHYALGMRAVITVS